MVYGLGSILYQANNVKDGRIVESNFHNFRIPRLHEMPKVETVLVPSGGFWGGHGEPAILPLVGWLIDNQCTETSELCPTTGPYWGSYSPANTAGLAIAALRLAGEDTTDQLTWLYAQQEADGGFPAAIGAGYSDVYATAQSLVAVTGSDLTSVGEDAEESEGAGRDNSARFLLGGLGILLALVVVLAVYRMRRSES